MKNRKMLDVIGEADEMFVNEADPTKQKAKSKAKFNWIAVLSAAACFLLILNISIIVPLLANNDEPSDPIGNSGLNHITQDGLLQNNSSKPSDDSTDSSTPSQGSTDHIQNPDVNEGEDGDKEIYSPDMQFLKNPQLLGALDKYFNYGYNGSIGDAMDKVEEELEDAFENEMNQPEKDQVTSDLGDGISPDLNDNQVTGVREGDIAKRSDKHLFYLRGTTLYVYSINGSASKAECMLPLGSYLEKAEELVSGLNRDKWEQIDDGYDAWQMYLSDDYKTLTIFISPDYEPKLATGVITLDVSAAPTVEFKDFKIFAGEYVTSRFVGDEILLFTKYTVNKYFDTENPMAYIPFYTEGEETRYTNDIYFPNELTASTYITVSRISQKKLRVLESVSYLSYSENIYVSGENVYLTREIPLEGFAWEFDFIETTDEDQSYRKFEPIDTEIAVIGYKSALFQNRGTVTVNGYVHNQYSLDEFEGILRVAPTSYIKNDGEKELSNPLTDVDIGYSSSASLWCINISTMKVVASVENFAPLDDVVRSVRFDGTAAYVCTSLQKLIFSDPVFFFDLSDLDNITYTDTGIIEGYSSSLINIGGGYLVGIGYTNNSTLKIEVYKEENGAVVTVCIEEFAKTNFSTDYKSYYVNRESHLLGLAISTYSNETKRYEDSYLLLHFDGEYFDKVMALGESHNNQGSVRAFYEKDYLYVVTDVGFYTFEVGRLNNLPFVSSDGTNTGASDAIDTDNTTTRPSGPAW